MTNKEIQASDEEMEQFNVLQNEKCVLAKEEKLNDLKNRISFVLKDAALQQGFEIICKRIAELEKENADLKAEIGLNEATIQDQLEDRIKVIKENEELKKQIDYYKAFESHYDEIEEDAKAIAEENEELKKNALVWHKVTCFDKPDEDGFITNDCPGDIGKEFLVRGKFGDYSMRELIEIDNGVIFDDCEWEDVDAWAEIPGV